MVAVNLLKVLGKLLLFISVNSMSTTSVTEIVQNININDTSKDFVRVLKDDLRRNNDDYIDATTKNTSNSYLHEQRLITNTTPTAKVEETFNVNENQFKKQNSFKHNRVNDINRRALDVSLYDEDTNTTNVVRQTANTFPKRFTEITKSQPITKQLNKKVSTKKNIKVNVNKLEKVKLFLNKNNVLLKDFINKKKMGILTGELKSTTGSILRMRANEIIEDHSLPNDEQLDMAPAKGGRIHAKRLKGRLCQRNVLIPEGPKYDSKGNVYLGAFYPKPGQDFARTVPPKVILPRCCNCCKKSVLGCE